MSRRAPTARGRQLAEAAAGKQIQPLTRIELDGRSVEFEYGMLLHGRGRLSGADWHVVLLRVPLNDVLAVGSASAQECAVAAETAGGEILAGRARVLPFDTAADCLRLIGTSSLERAG
jgi:hypothetical protein